MNSVRFCEEYLKRICFEGSSSPTVDVLFKLHEHHVRSIPFENLSIHCGERISLAPDKLFHKVVNENRGGFCYELNFLFYQLLIRMGYSCTMVSSRIYNTDGSWGPDYDHLSLIVACDDGKFLLDVGYGDLFLKPVALIENKVQTDGKNYFKIQKEEVSGDYILLMSVDGSAFEIRYRFNLSGCAIEDFSAINQYKQTHPDSYFVKNIVCTKPTSAGRTTLFNNKLIIHTGSGREERVLEDTSQFKSALTKYFGIQLEKEFSYPLLTR
jgi:N-hydroxyarylamine O-acetyltransferase